MYYVTSIGDGEFDVTSEKTEVESPSIRGRQSSTAQTDIKMPRKVPSTLASKYKTSTPE